MAGKMFKRKFEKGNRIELKNDTILYGYGVAKTKGITGTINSYMGDSIYEVFVDKRIEGFTSGSNNRCYVTASKMNNAHEFRVELL